MINNKDKKVIKCGDLCVSEGLKWLYNVSAKEIFHGTWESARSLNILEAAYAFTFLVVIQDKSFPLHQMWMPYSTSYVWNLCKDVMFGHEILY